MPYKGRCILLNIKKAKASGLSFFFFLAVIASGPVIAEWFYEKRPIMGTEVSVSLWAEDPVKGERLVAKVMAIMQGVDQRLSPYIDSSDLSILNANAARVPVKLSDELSLLYKHSQRVFLITGGAFDITFASVGKYYDYRNKYSPSDSDVTRLLPALNTEHLLFDDSSQTLKFLHPDVTIDLGGIAKGYAVDLVIEYLKQNNIKHAYVGAGGDSRVLGDRRGRPWVVGIKNPRLSYAKQASNSDEPLNESVIRLPLDNIAISTSGDYERFFIDDKTGRRIHHIINPKTGRSVSGVMSVTILGDTGLETDPLSTAVFVMGVEKGLALINKLPNNDAIIIDNKGKVHYSNGLMPQAQH